jgi:hypothetical protein
VAINNTEVEKVCQKREVQANKEPLIFGMDGGDLPARLCTRFTRVKWTTHPAGRRGQGVTPESSRTDARKARGGRGLGPRVRQREIRRHSLDKRQP